MARIKDKEQALILRAKGYSYSQIKEEMGLSKSTLSGWLREHPLSEEKIRELRDVNPRRIENCRNTKARKVKERLDKVYQQVVLDISTINHRELFIAGIFFYWGEGSKSERCTTGLSNTDPAMIKFFLKWLKLLKVDFKKLHITLQLYIDMDIKKEIKFWSEELELPINLFKKPYIKDSALSGLTYKRGFAHGTCNVRVYNRDLAEYIHMAMKYLGVMKI